MLATVCDLLMLTFRSYRIHGTTVFFKRWETYAPAIQWNDRRTQFSDHSAIDTGKGAASKFNGGASSITLVLGLYKCERCLPVAHCSVAHRIFTFCNRFDAVCKSGTVERFVEWLNCSIKPERKWNGTLTL